MDGKGKDGVWRVCLHQTPTDAAGTVSTMAMRARWKTLERAWSKGLRRKSASSEPNHEPVLEVGTRDVPQGYPLDTLTTATVLQEAGLSQTQSHQLTRYLTQVIEHTIKRVTDTTVTKAQLEKLVVEQKSAFDTAKGEIRSSTEANIASLRRDIERLEIETDKIRSELRFGIDKLQASQRLDLNLEKGRIRDEMQNALDKSADVDTRLDREIYIMKTNIESSKSDIIKYCVGTIVSTTAVGLGMLRVLTS